jgi:hypothetical protein
MLKIKSENLLRIKYSDYVIALLAYFLIALSVLGGVIFSPGTIGFFHDWFLGPYPEMNYHWADAGFYIWDSQSGNKIYATDWIFRVALYPFSFLGGEVLSKGLLIFIITLSGFSAFCLGKQLKLSPIISFAAGVLYILSPIIFTRIVAGHIYYLVAYLLAPLILANFLRGREENRNKYFIISGILLSFAFIQIQFIVMVFIILLIFSLIDFRNIKKSTRGLLITMSIGFLINLSPVVFSQMFVGVTDPQFNINRLLSYGEVIFAPDLLKSFRLLGYDAHGYSYENLSNDGIIPTWILYLDLFFPIIGFSSLIFFGKNKYVLSFAVISIIGLFLLKGLNPPLSEIFRLLFTHGFYIFREIWHIAFLYALSLTFLTAFLLEKIKSHNFNKLFKFPFILILISLIVVSNGYPILIGNFGGYLQTYDFPEDYHAIYKSNSSDPTYNTLILPFIRPIHYDALKLAGVDPISKYWSNNIMPTEFDKQYPTTGFAAWLLSVMQENKTDGLGRLLSGFGIKYIVLRNDFVSTFPEYVPLGTDPHFRDRWYTSVEPFLDAQKDLVLISNTTQYKIYKNMNEVTKIFSPKILAGGLSDFNSLLSISNLTSLSSIAVYPSIYGKEDITFVDNLQDTRVPSDDFVELGAYANSSDAKIGWTDNRDWFGYNYLLASRIPQGAFTGLNGAVLSFELPSNHENKPIEIWLKALMWNKGGKIKVNVNGEDSFSSSLFSTNQSLQNFKVFEGRSSDPYHLSVENINGENYLEGIYIREEGAQRPPNNTNGNPVVGIEDQRKNNLIHNPEFVLFDNYSSLPLYWSDPWEICHYSQKQDSIPLANLGQSNVNCKVNSTTGWLDNTSLQVATRNPTNTWSPIYGNEIEVKPNERYELVTHMKLNNFATQSHIVIEAFNETLKNWEQIKQCPSGIDGPLEWQQFSCEVTIPENTRKIRVVLNAGWSSMNDEPSTTFFDAIYMYKLTDEGPTLQNLDQIKRVISQSQPQMISDYTKINPAHWNVRMNTSKPFMVGFAEPYDPAWEARIYKNGEKLDVARSIPLYGVLNAFLINETGNLEIEIKYARQDWFEIGLVVSAATLAFCIFWLFYDWRRNRLKKILSS